MTRFWFTTYSQRCPGSGENATTTAVPRVPLGRPSEGVSGSQGTSMFRTKVPSRSNT